MRIQLLARTVVAGLCTAALVAAPSLTSAATARPAEHARAALPTITAKITKQGVSLKGVNDLHAGRATLVVRGTSQASATFATLKKGYDLASLRKDLVAGFSQKKPDVKAIKRVYAKTDAIGGLAPGSTGTIVFPHPGRYFAFYIGNRGPSRFTTFDVGARRASRTPQVDGRIVGADGPAWEGSTNLPAKGTLMFKNAASYPVLHFMDLQQVQEGTTVQQVLDSFQSDQQGPPDWALPGSLFVDVVSPQRSMTVDYDLPPGQYVVLCFMPDPKMGGMPHALMGMVEMIHLG